MTEYEVDTELIAEFIDETRENLAPIDDLLLQLENDIDNEETINAIFRPIHSLKGSASFFGLHKTQKLSHAMEDLMSVFRKKERKIVSQDIAILLNGLDLLRSMIDSFAETHDEKTDDKIIEELINALKKRIHGEKKDITLQLTKIQTGLCNIKKKSEDKIHPEIDNLLKEIDNILKEQKKDHTNQPETLKNFKRLLNIASQREPTKEEQQQIRESIILLRTLSDNNDASALLSQALDEFDTFTNALGYDPLLHELLTEKLKKLETFSWKEEDRVAPKIKSPEKKEKLQTEKPPQPQKKQETNEVQIEKTMRISEAKLDSFLQYVGELVVIEEMFAYQRKQLLKELKNEILTRNFTQTLKSFSELSGRLREGILSIRKVPVKRLLQKASRLIHDVAVRTGKEINVEIQGEDEVIDKSYMELLDAPFVHILRNAVDHGIEKPEVREQIGKQRRGTIKIHVLKSGEEIIIRISDDGAGINREKVKKKAIELGIISATEEITDKTLTELIFSSGFSTAEKVSDISGRGVGMDVVKKNIEAAGGTIKTSTKEGIGSTFEIILPENVSTQIEDGFVIAAGHERFVIPMQNVKNTCKTDTKELKTLNGIPVIEFQNMIIPVISLSHFFSIENNNTEKFSYMVIVESNGKIYALKVNKIIGITKIVVKPFDNLNENSRFYRGAAIMGDGALVLTLDIDELINHVTREGFQLIKNRSTKQKEQDNPE